MILEYHVSVKYFLFPLNVFRYLSFRSFAINSHVNKSHKIADFLGIAPISLRF